MYECTLPHTSKTKLRTAHEKNEVERGGLEREMETGLIDGV